MPVDYLFSLLFIFLGVAAILAPHPLTALFFSFLMGIGQSLILLHWGMSIMAYVSLFFVINSTLFLYAFILLLYRDKKIHGPRSRDIYLIAGGIVMVLLLLGLMSMSIDENYEFLVGKWSLGKKGQKSFSDMFQYFITEYAVPLQFFPLFLLGGFFSCALLLKKSGLWSPKNGKGS